MTTTPTMVILAVALLSALQFQTDNKSCMVMSFRFPATNALQRPTAFVPTGKAYRRNIFAPQRMSGKTVGEEEGGGGVEGDDGHIKFSCIPGTEVTVAKVRSVDEAREIVREADESHRCVAVQRSEPDSSSSLNLPRGSVVMVFDDDCSIPELRGNKVERVVAVTAAAAAEKGPSLKVKRPALLRDLVAEQLKDESIRHVFLPLAAGQSKAPLSDLFRGTRDNDPHVAHNYFQRSAGTLASHVESFSYLPLSKSPPTANAASEDEEKTKAESDFPVTTWSKGEVGATPSFNDKLVLDATLQVNPKEAKMEVRRIAFLYDEQFFNEYVLDAFNKNYPETLKGDKLDGIDLTVEVFNKPMYVVSQVFVLITACSTKRGHDEAVEALFPDLHLVPAESELLVDPIDIYGMGAGVPEGTSAFNLDANEYGGSLTIEAFGQFSEWLKGAVRAAAFEANQNLLAHFRLLEKKEIIYVDATVFKPDEVARPGWIKGDLDSVPGFPDDPPPNLKKLSAPSVAIPTARISAEASALASEPEVAVSSPPGLEGVDIVLPEDDTYNKCRGQYASFKGSYPDKDFRPNLIALPRDVSQIMKVVDYAAAYKKRVVVRSGGHQYCGFSSGDDGYVQVLMDYVYMENVEGMKDGIGISHERARDVRGRKCSLVSPDGPGDDAMQWFVTVAPACRLQNISKKLVEASLTIPHGECPLVGIGGHVQTGGYGHQMRGLGLCLDYVYSFDIVVRPEKDGPARLVTVYRPELDLSDDDDAPGIDRKLNDELYKGVLGGSPGAFGVLTRIKFLTVHDDDPAVSDCRNIQAIYMYRGTGIAKGATEIVRTMLKYTPSQKLEEGLDVFISIVSYKLFGCWEFGVVNAELAYTGTQYTDNVKGQIDEFVDACKSRAMWFVRHLLPLFSGMRLGPRRPSVVAHKGVRTAGSGVTKRGHEFDWPYKKRVNIMLDKLPEDKAEAFAQQFGKLTSDVVLDDDLMLVIQMNMGGGKSKSNDEQGRTGLQYRDQTFGFVFDIFYMTPEAEKRAVDIQTRMEELLYTTGGFNNRVFWGSFGRENGETDLSKQRVRDLYYGTEGAYRNMQKIKKMVDPQDLFTTEFTVETDRPKSPYYFFEKLLLSIWPRKTSRTQNSSQA